jgi:hypothetical protein
MSLPSGVYVTRFDLDPVPMVTGMGRALSGYEQTIAGPDAIWTGILEVTVPVQRFAAWNAFIDAMDGGVSGFTLPLADLWSATSYPAGSPTVTSAATALAAVVRVTHTGQAAAWDAGMAFNLNGTTHRVLSASVSDANTVDLTIRPRLRAAASISDALSAASLTMRLQDPRAGRVRPGGVAHDEVSLPIIERLTA